MSSMVKIVLLADLPNVGQRNDVKSVRFGFAKNWLIPQKFAQLATERVLLEISRRKDRQKEEKQKKSTQTEALLAALKDLTLTMRPKKSAKGTLYAAIDAHKIADSLKKKGFVVNPEMIRIEEPIKKVGEYKICIVFSKEIQGILKLVIQ